MGTYEKIVGKHKKNDKKVSWKDLEEAQKIVTSYSRSLGKIFRIGENMGERNRDR